MPEELTAAQAAGRLHAVDTLGIPLGPGQPPTLLQALGQRDDWIDLRVYGALLAVLTELFSRTGVHYVSGFFGPLERALRDGGADVEFAPADFRRFGPLLQRQAPRVMTTVAAPPDADGWCSLSLHAGGTIDELRRAGADPDRLLIVEVAEKFPRTYGLADHRHALHVDEIDILVVSDAEPLALPGGDAEPSEVDRAIAEHAVAYMPSGVTLQTGIGSIPNQIATLLAEGEGGNYGLHSEMFTDGCMKLHRAGKITNTHKGQYDGVSVTTFAFGSPELYEWLDDNHEVAFLPVEIVNAPEVIARNHRMVTINGALAIDIHGQVVADTIDGGQFSGIGGAEDFVAGAGRELSDRSLICLPSTYEKDGRLQSRIVPWLGAGAVITTPRHQVDVIVTEYGTAELEGLTVRQRGEALAAIAHPQFREGLLKAAERAANGALR
ncbi:acetyl-CoA hydrolase/transferase family protein [Mycolicibacterium goodii]|uniref:4-hydroxybutyrate CoA-transferase n=1 Tax=Mycolicibacterium goodii TaxID=134601 RepID=A0A0K0X1K0_MYCGD|nr:4-hydroxybutyrate CoA-transferase [Mycolicibacterium goodii]